MAIQIRELTIKAEIRGWSEQESAPKETVAEEIVRKIVREVTQPKSADDNTSRRER